MARMIPGYGPAETEALSHEDEIYYSLKNLLPNDFTVVHSFKLAEQKGKNVGTREADFVIFHKELGILCIEAKYTNPRCQNGEWRYGSGKIMPGGGPYRQAESFMWKLSEKFEDLKMDRLKGSCKMLHAVWFHKISTRDLDRLSAPEGLRALTLCKDDLKDPEKRIRQIFSLTPNGWRGKTDLTKQEANEILQKIICPEFEIIPSLAPSKDYNEFLFIRLLESQARVLDFLKDQKTAVINGAAGTGKTLIAVKRAEEAAKDGKVLFLCFNRLLKDDVRVRLAGTKNVEVHNLHSLAREYLGRFQEQIDYSALIDAMFDNFPYDHVIVDEGQDFGKTKYEVLNKLIGKPEVLGVMRDLIEEKENGTMYLFYDKRQLVQSVEMPAIINDADSKLSLYVNCRNTEGIAKCTMKSIRDPKGPKVRLGSAVGGPPRMLVTTDADEQVDFVDSEIKALRAEGVDDIAVLTCKTIQGSALGGKGKGEFAAPGHDETWKKTGVPVYTCRTFKGMEADAVILIDVTDDLWAEDDMATQTDIARDSDNVNGLVFYTGASRAKHDLGIVCDMDDDACFRVLARLEVKGTTRPATRLAKALDAVLA